MEHFGDKIEEIHSCSETNPSRHTSRLSIDKDTLSSLDSEARRWADLFEADLSPDDPYNYKTTPRRLLPNIYSVCHCLGRTPRFYFLLFTTNSFRVFSRFGEKIQDSFRALY